MQILGAHRTEKTAFLKYVSNPDVYRAKLKGPCYIANVDLECVRDTGSFYRAVTPGCYLTPDPLSTTVRLRLAKDACRVTGSSTPTTTLCPPTSRSRSRAATYRSPRLVA